MNERNHYAQFNIKGTFFFRQPNTEVVVGGRKLGKIDVELEFAGNVFDKEAWQKALITKSGELVETNVIQDGRLLEIIYNLVYKTGTQTDLSIDLHLFYDPTFEQLVEERCLAEIIVFIKRGIILSIKSNLFVIHQCL